jgi:hypothetical protein
MKRNLRMHHYVCVALVGLSAWTVSAQNAAQLCPPCAAVAQAQKIPDDLAPEALTTRDWAIGERGINVASWQARQGGAHRIGTGSTILQIDTGITRHPLLPPLNGERGVDFEGADGFFGIGYSNQDPLLSGFLRFPGHGTKTSSVITATAPPVRPDRPPTAAIIAGGSLTAGIEVAVSYSYGDDVLSGESRESEIVTATPSAGSQTIRVTVTGSPDPLVGTIYIYAQDRGAIGDPGRRRVGSVKNPGAQQATFDITSKTWSTGAEAPTTTPWRPDALIAGQRLRGAAPGTRLIPLRGTQGVLLIPGKLGELDTEPWRIANALNQAALGANGLFRRRIDVVSMSLGTFPETQGLCAAVERATKAGVIVIAAAGNEIRRTKYPARCPTAIAVAGSNYQQRPWRGSAGSPEVAVAAPAEGVWTASVIEGTYCVEASHGTSFATALVAAMAAEWVAFHRAKGTFPADPVGTVTNPGPFRAALIKSARPWGGSNAAEWRGKYGAGIADLSRLMSLEGNNASP